MRTPNKYEGVKQATDRLAEIFGVGPVPDTAAGARFRTGGRWDAVLDVGPYCFWLEYKSSGSLGQVAVAVHQLTEGTDDSSGGPTPLLVVPYMGEAARAHCNQAGVAWLDLSGNARIVIPDQGLFVQHLGCPNQFRRPGRPENAFGPKGSRLTRHLLMNPEEPVSQRILASITGLNEGHLSRLVGKLVESGLVERGAEGIRVTDFDLLLDAWQEEYRFDRHRVIPGHIAAVSGDGLTRALAGALTELETPYAMTGLPAAWLWTQHAAFRLSTVYLSEVPSAALLMELGFREEPRGANTWLVVPNDDGVFHGAGQVAGIRCVHPIQAYLDLKDHPERASEAAEVVRSRLLLRGRHGR